MVLWATLIIFIYGAVLVGSVPYGGAPENITIMFLSPSEVKVSWRTQAQAVEKYDVTYKPTDARVVVVVAGNSESVTLTGLQAGTQYQVVITAVAQGKKFRSRPVVFKTLEISPPQDPVHITGIPPGPAGKNYRPIPPHPNTNPQLVQGVYQVRGVEVGIVCLVLVVWVAAIALFFNRWGKIRMLLPYQPDYKDSQLKVPGTCQTNNHSTCQQNSTIPFCSSQNCGCGGWCCLLLERCFSLITPSTTSQGHDHHRDCNCRFALLHRVDPA